MNKQPATRILGMTQKQVIVLTVFACFTCAIVIGFVGLLIYGRYPINGAKPISPQIIPAPPTTQVSSVDGAVMVYIPAGEFTMGETANLALALCEKFRTRCELSWFSQGEPKHQVYLDAYWINQTEITNAMYVKFLNRVGALPGLLQSHRYIYLNEKIISASECINCENWVDRIVWDSSHFVITSGYEQHPVVLVNWTGASEYCAWAGRRLLTEAEWEKAARGIDGYIYPWGNEFDGTRLNFCDKNCINDWADRSVNDGYSDTAPVGVYLNGASPFGVLDMAGNVFEWVADRYDENYYFNTPRNNPTGPTSGNSRVFRGGSWYYDEYGIRTYTRDGDLGEMADPGIGFRCATSP